VDVNEPPDHLRQWLEAVQRGKEITVTERRGPVARSGLDLAGISLE
jgi:antitoxin (DNA-binding transcriptional repressor) of toxin-antitoxin stability system